MPAEAYSFSLEVFVSTPNFQVVVYIGFFLHKIFDIIEVLVGIMDVIVSCSRFGRALEFAQKIPIQCEFLCQGIRLTLLPVLSHFWIEDCFFAPAAYPLFQRHEIVDSAS